MESNEARELERTLARAEAAPYLSYPTLPRWYPLAFAGWFAGVLALFPSLDRPWGILAMVGLIVVEVVFLTWFERAHGAMPWPGKGNPPEEIARVYRAYFTGLFVVVATVALVWWLLGHWPAVAALVVLATAGFWLYDWRYEVAAAKVRERLA